MKPLTTRGTLKAALALIEDPEHWTQGRMSRKQWLPEGGRLVQYCSLGAINKVARIGRLEAQATLRLTEAFGMNIIGYNDNLMRQHSEIVAGFKKAIKS